MDRLYDGKSVTLLDTFKLMADKARGSGSFCTSRSRILTAIASPKPFRRKPWLSPSWSLGVSAILSKRVGKGHRYDMVKGHVYITDYITDPYIEREVLGENLVSEPSESVKALLVWHQKIDSDYLNQFPNLTGLVRYGVGYDSIDIDEVLKRNLILCNTPDYGVDEVSDTALAMAMNITRGVNIYDVRCRHYESGWQENTLPHLRRTSEVSLGIVGAGRIGSALARRAKAIGFDVRFFDPFKDSGYEKALGVQRAFSLEELLSSSDLISLHLPLNNETAGLVNKNFLNSIKKGASIINTARGELIADLDEVYHALSDGNLFSVGLDVLPEEPPGRGKLLEEWRSNGRLSDRIIICPHTAYYSQEAFKDMRTKASQNARAIIEGAVPRNVIVGGAGS